MRSLSWALLRMSIVALSLALAPGLAVGASPDPSVLLAPGFAFSLTGTLHDPRINAGALLLPDGRVLVVGGHDMSSAEVWDPVAGERSVAGTMAAVREEPRLELLADGRVLVTGGHDGEVSASVGEIWNPGSGSFAVVDGPVPSPMPRPSPRPDGTLPPGQTAVDEIRPAHGRRLTLGGWTKTDPECTGLCSVVPGATAELIDPATGTRTPVGPTVHPRADARLVRLIDGRILVIGGHCHCGLDATVGLFAPVD